ncbi:hypothetical protein [Methylotuvimicrobium sp. KM2]|uniref:hypothetical protein n=1 Tax=Methylotuvimicrobium sp. KM2 TaxID=3133976 RepID=UPI0031016048
MPLQQLVEHFNDRLEWEHHSNFRPFFLKEGVVHGLFGPIHITTELAPLRETLKPLTIAGYIAKLNVSTSEIPHLQSHELDLIISLPARQSICPDSIVDFDRLARTVHMLNFLPISHEPFFLQLEVDPRHILGVKKDHGAYFQEVIGKCGLEPNNIVITLSVGSVYANYYEALLKGLENYRQRGYRVALKIDYNGLSGSALELITALSPDNVALSAKDFGRIQDNQLPNKLHRLHKLTDSVGGQTALLDIEDANIKALARTIGFNWVQGTYYEQSVASIEDTALHLSRAV